MLPALDFCVCALLHHPPFSPFCCSFLLFSSCCLSICSLLVLFFFFPFASLCLCCLHLLLRLLSSLSVPHSSLFVPFCYRPVRNFCAVRFDLSSRLLLFFLSFLLLSLSLFLSFVFFSFRLPRIFLYPLSHSSLCSCRSAIQLCLGSVLFSAWSDLLFCSVQCLVLFFFSIFFLSLLLLLTLSSFRPGPSVQCSPAFRLFCYQPADFLPCSVRHNFMLLLHVCFQLS